MGKTEILLSDRRVHECKKQVLKVLFFTDVA